MSKFWKTSQDYRGKIPKTLLIPNILMLLYNGIELDRSLLQFKHKASFILDDYISYSPTNRIQWIIIYDIIRRDKNKLK